MNQTQRQELLERLDEYLTYCGYVAMESSSFRRNLYNACIVDSSFYGDALPNGVLFGDVTKILPESVHINTVFKQDGRFGLGDEARFIVNNVETMNKAEIAGLCRMLDIKQRPDILLMHTATGFDQHAQGITHVMFHGFKRNYAKELFSHIAIPDSTRKAFVRMSSRNDYHDQMQSGLNNMFACALGFEVLLPKHWLAHVSCAGAPPITLLTDPTGVQDLFKFRDKLPSQVRRPQLLHWVSEHYRQNRKVPEVEILVRKHLRGHRNFKHGELSVTIEESMEDAVSILDVVEERKQLDRQRAAWRKRQK